MHQSGCENSEKSDFFRVYLLKQTEALFSSRGNIWKLLIITLSWSELKKMSSSHTSLCCIRLPVDPESSLWLTLCRSLENTQQRCGANRQEPKGHAKVWHLLGGLGIHKPNPECILKPAATDGCDMTERQSGGSRCSVQLGSSVSVASQGRMRSLISLITDEISVLKNPIGRWRIIKSNK